MVCAGSINCTFNHHDICILFVLCSGQSRCHRSGCRWSTRECRLGAANARQLCGMRFQLFGSVPRRYRHANAARTGTALWSNTPTSSSTFTTTATITTASNTPTTTPRLWRSRRLLALAAAELSAGRQGTLHHRARGKCLQNQLPLPLPPFPPHSPAVVVVAFSSRITARHTLKHFLPLQVAGLVFYLAQDEAAAITGSNVWRVCSCFCTRSPSRALAMHACDFARRL